MKTNPYLLSRFLFSAGLLGVVPALQAVMTDNVNDATLEVTAPITENFDTTAFTAEVGEPAHAGHTATKSAWVKFAAPTTGVYVFSTVGSAFDTALDVYEPGATLAEFKSISRCNNIDGQPAPGTNTASECRVFIQAGDVVAVAVDGVAGVGGLATLSISLATTTEPNDNLANAQAITGALPITVTGSNLNASHEFGEPQHGGGTTVGSSSIWYKWTAPTSKTYIISTAGSTQNLTTPAGQQDTLLGIYTSATPTPDYTTLTVVPGGNVNDVGNGDLTSRFVFNPIAGTTYYIAVDGRGSVSTFNHRGVTKLNIELSPTQTIVPFFDFWEWYAKGDDTVPINPQDDPSFNAHPNFPTSWAYTAEGFTVAGGPAYDGPTFESASPAMFAFGGVDFQNPPATNLPHKQQLYVRKKITVTEAVPYLIAEILADDAAFIYVDGVMRRRFNVDPTVTDDTFAAYTLINAPSETVPTLLGLNTGLTVGTHVIAVSVHNQSAGSSDLGFDIRLSAESRKPTIVSALNVIGSVGAAGAYQIVAGVPAESYNALNLPPGLTVDPATGIISGTPTTAGSFNTTLEATNPNGTTSVAAAFTITPPYGAIALVPGTPLSTGFEEPARGSTSYVRTTGTELGFDGSGISGDGTNTAGAAFAYGVVGPVTTNATDHPAAGGVGSAAPNTAPPGKWLKLNNKGFGSAAPLIIEKINVSALSPAEKAAIVAKIDVRALTNSGTSFETADYMRIWIEGSTDGITFTQIGNRLVDLTGLDASAGTDPIITAFRSDAGAYKTLSSEGLVTITPEINSIRMVINSRNDSGSEFFYFDNVRFSIAPPADADGDGLNDAWETTYFGNTTAQNGSGDPDGDGSTNASEQLAGTIPTSAASVLRATAVSRPSNTTVQVTFQSVAGKKYVVQSNANLGTGNWIDTSAPTTATGASTTIAVPVSQFVSTLFFRVSVVP